MAFQLDLPKFEAAGAQVLGVSVDVNDANKAWAEKMGVTYPLLSDVRRQMAKAYNVLYDDPKLAQAIAGPVVRRGTGLGRMRSRRYCRAHTAVG